MAFCLLLPPSMISVFLSAISRNYLCICQLSQQLWKFLWSNQISFAPKNMVSFLNNVKSELTWPWNMKLTVFSTPVQLGFKKWNLTIVKTSPVLVTDGLAAAIVILLIYRENALLGVLQFKKLKAYAIKKKQEILVEILAQKGQKILHDLIRKSPLL